MKICQLSKNLFVDFNEAELKEREKKKTGKKDLTFPAIRNIFLNCIFSLEILS